MMEAACLVMEAFDKYDDKIKVNMKKVKNSDCSVLYLIFYFFNIN